MATTIRMTALAAVIGACLGGSVCVNHAEAAGNEQLTSATRTYMIEFADAGALYYSGGVGNLRATAPSAGAKPQKFNANSADAQSYRTWVRERQGEYLASMAAQLGHAIEVTHSYEITHSGVAAKLTAEEASAIAKLLALSGKPAAG